MAKTVLNFRTRRISSLSCVWIETGNPAQPLVCRWSTRSKSRLNLATIRAEEPPSCRPRA